MDYNQFMHLMVPRVPPGKESINVLQDFVNEFPYFQSAQIMLARSMHEFQHVRYDKQLKIAAAYAVDRKVLYNLIHSNESISVKEKQAEPKPVFALPDEPVVEENIFVSEEDAFVIPPIEDEREILNEINISEPDTIHYQQAFEMPEDDFVEKQMEYEDPHEIIRKRLSEILGLKDENKVEMKMPVEEQTPVDEYKPETVREPAVAESSGEEKKNPEELLVVPHREEPLTAVSHEPSIPSDINDKAQMEHALESSIIQSIEKLPVIDKPKAEFETIAATTESPRTFYDWLKQKSMQGFGSFEEVHAYDAEKTETKAPVIEEPAPVEPVRDEKRLEVEKLIDRFIETDPKIVPSKTEFYSPVNQAKKSVTENEDVVSETLAKIYFQQGNLAKARASYERLVLLFPEKKAYFAALISEVDQATNNLNKQDL